MIDHIAFVVPDIAEAVAWYDGKIDLEVLYQDETWAMVKVNGAKLAFVLPGQHPNHFAIKSELHEFPCEEEEIKSHRDRSQYYYLKDPYGNAIEWIHYPQKAT